MWNIQGADAVLGMIVWIEGATAKYIMVYKEITADTYDTMFMNNEGAISTGLYQGRGRKR